VEFIDDSLSVVIALVKVGAYIGYIVKKENPPEVGFAMLTFLNLDVVNILKYVDFSGEAAEVLSPSLDWCSSKLGPFL
jgi:hypothetical protein